MNRFLLQIAARKDIAPVATEGTRQASAQALVKEQTHNLVTVFLHKEASIAEGKASPLDLKLFERWTGLVRDMFAAYDMIPEEQLVCMTWLDPVLMPCIVTKTESIRLAIQRLAQKLHASTVEQAPQTNPEPEVEDETVPEHEAEEQLDTTTSEDSSNIPAATEE